MATATGDGTSFWRVLKQSLRTGLFGTLYVMQKKHHSVPILSVTAVIIKALQIMSFVLGDHHFHWKYTIIVAQVVSMSTTASGWFRVTSSPYVYLAVFFISFAWVLMFLGLMVWALRAFMKGEVTSLWPIKLFAAVGGFSATVAFIPLSSILLSSFQCEDPYLPFWRDAGFFCFQGAHLAISIISAVLGSAFVACCTVFAGLVYDSHSLTPNLAGKAHGRVDVALLLLKTALVITIDVLPHMMGGPWTLIGLNIGGGVAWTWMVYSYMPFIHHAMNGMYLGVGCLYTFASIVLAIQQSVSEEVDVAALLYVGIPAAVIMGRILADHRRASILAMPVSKFSGIFDVDLYVRFTLQEAMKTTMELATLGVETRLLKEHDVSGGGGSGKDGGGAKAAAPGPTVGSSGPGSGSSGTAIDPETGESAHDHGMVLAAFDSMSTEERVSWLRNRIPSRVLWDSEDVLRAAVIRFPSSAFLHVFQARFYSVYHADGRNMHMSHLVHAQRLHPALDVEYLAFAARRTLKTDGAMGTSGNSAVARVAFDKHLGDARSAMLRALENQVAFWAELCDSKPDIARMHRLSTRIHGFITSAETHFQELFLLNPQSLPAMRLYAQYHLFMGDAEKGAATSAEAERIEDQKSNDHLVQSSSSASSGIGLTAVPGMDPGDMLKDSIATVSIDASLRNLGDILQCNTAACRLFGYTRMQLERRNINILIPSPFAEKHDAWLRRHLLTGEGSVLERVRIMLGRHSSGSIFPFRILVRAGYGIDGSHNFLATMKPINSADNYLLLDDKFRLTGISNRSSSVTGIEPAYLLGHEVHLREIMPECDNPGVLRAMMNDTTGVVLDLWSYTDPEEAAEPQRQRALASVTDVHHAPSGSMSGQVSVAHVAKGTSHANVLQHIASSSTTATSSVAAPSSSTVGSSTGTGAGSAADLASHASAHRLQSKRSMRGASSSAALNTATSSANLAAGRTPSSANLTSRGSGSSNSGHTAAIDDMIASINAPLKSSPSASGSGLAAYYNSIFNNVMPGIPSQNFIHPSKNPDATCQRVRAAITTIAVTSIPAVTVYALAWRPMEQQVASWQHGGAGTVAASAAVCRAKGLKQAATKQYVAVAAAAVACRQQQQKAQQQDALWLIRSTRRSIA